MKTKKVSYEDVEEWFYDHDLEWQNDLENDFYNSDNTEGETNHVVWAYLQYHENVKIVL